MRETNTSAEPGRAIVVAASAGGIDALMRLTARLTAACPAPVLVVQHLRAGERETRLPQVLGRRCALPVVLAENGMPARPGRVYLARPDYHLRVEHGFLLLDSGPPVQYVRPAADVLFRSAARYYGAGVVGVVLTGSGRDGTAGCQAVKQAGGVTIAQDQESSFNYRMPGSAIEAGCVDLVLPLDAIAERMTALAADNAAVSAALSDT